MTNLKLKLFTAGSALLLAGTLAAGAQTTTTTTTEEHTTIIRNAPPAPIEETMPPVPAEHPTWVWQPGYHRWDGAHYTWVPGRYVQPPYEHARWIPGHWDNRDGGYIWVEGRWDRE